MPKKHDDLEKSEIVRVRVSSKMRKRCTEARLAGIFFDEAESTFMGHLIKLGIEKYEKVMLPLEKEGEEENPAVPTVKKQKRA